MVISMAFTANSWTRWTILLLIVTFFLVWIHLQSIEQRWLDSSLSFLISSFRKSALDSEDQLRCLLDANRVFQTLNVSWFINFGSALFYHRNKSFNTHDVDTGIFYHDLLPVADRLVDTFRAHGFRLLSSYGSLEHGQEWGFQCPRTAMKMDIFTFYPPLPNDIPSPSFAWWTAMYGGKECDRKRYNKCRLRFSSIELEQIVVKNTVFRLVPKKFLIEHYGKSWTTPISYTYYQSMPFLCNIMNE